VHERAAHLHETAAERFEAARISESNVQRASALATQAAVERGRSRRARNRAQNARRRLAAEGYGSELEAVDA